ncbi:autotransporter domain-containing protein [Microbulbifer sp. SSSA002]|uniref:autotransporter domain-containing protein n=1 Tax=Microbulbifer sp. SSSA002 TaxID=3243376 RepID=UPI00403A02D6
MHNAKRSLAAAIALATMTSPAAFAKDTAFSQVIAFGDSLTDVGNYDVFTNGGDDREVAISILSQNLGLGAVTPSCADLTLCLPDVDLSDTSMTTEELLAEAQAQVSEAFTNSGNGWAVGGHKAADVLVNIIGSENYYAYLEASGITYDSSMHSFASALLPDRTRDTETGLYPDLTQLAYVLAAQEDPTLSSQMRAAGDLYTAAGDTDTASYYYSLADAIDEAPATIIADSGTTGSPFPLGMGYLETTLGSVDHNALYWVNGGGNDLLSGFSSVAAGTATTEEVTADLEIASTMLASAAGALSDAGANYILLSNVPDISKTPGVYAAAYEAVYSSDDAATLQAAVDAGLITQDEADAELADAIDGVLSEASAAAASFNADLLSKAKDIDGVLMVDQSGILQVALNNPSLLGLPSDLDQSQYCYDDSGNDCIEHPVYGIDGSDPDADQLIFNDSVHPTQIGQEILADYYTAVVNAAQVAGQLPDIAIQAARTHTNSLDESLASVRYRPAQTGVFAGSSLGNIDYDTDYTANVRGDGYSNVLGLTYALRDNAEIGFAVSRSNIDVDNSQLAIDSTSTNYSFFGRMHYDIFFVESNATLTDVDYDEVSRAVSLADSYSGDLTGNTSGQNLSLGITAGANLLDSGTFQFGPFVSFTRVTTDVDGYTEDAIEGFTYTDANGNEQDPLGMNYGDQERRLRNMRFGAFASKSWETVNTYAEIWYEDTNGTEEDTIEVGVKSMEGNMNAMPSYASVDEGIFNGGMGMIAGIRWQAADAIAVNATVASRPTTESASVNVTYRF